MKKTILFLATALFIATQFPAAAQFADSASTSADNALTKVFGTNLNFSATMEMQVKKLPQNDDLTLAGKIYFANGNSRTEMDMTKIRGSKVPPHAADQMKAMGMDQMISITRNDTKTVYMIYPGLESYAQTTSPDAKADAGDTKVETTELGRETLDGHPCVKNKHTVTNTKTGDVLVMTAWSATDLKNYPIKIEINSDAKNNKTPTTTTLHFVDINTAKPAASLFEPPLGYRVYTDVRAMMQTEMMKKMGGGNTMPGMPPGHPKTP